MKLRILALTVAVCLFCLPGLSLAAEDYPLTNGDFEIPYTGTYMPGWSFFGGSYGDSFDVIEGGNTGEGHCLKIVKGSSATFAYTTKEFDFVEGELYSISLWALNLSGTGISLKLEIYDGPTTSGSRNLVGDSMTKTIGMAEEWQNIKYSFIAPAGGKLLVIYLRNYGAEGTAVYFDNIRFGKESFVFPNSDLEESAGTVPAGWGTYGTAASWYTTGDSEGAHSGSSYIAINGTGNPSIYFAGIPVTGGARYKISFFYKYIIKTQDGAPRISVYYNTNPGAAWGTSLYSTSAATYAETISPCPEDTWIKCTYYIVAPPENCYLALHLIGFTNWISCYDDIMVEEDTNSVELCNDYGDKVETLTPGKIYARGRCVPTGDTASAKLIIASYLVEGKTKTLLSVDIQSAETDKGEPMNLEAELTVDKTENVRVQAYLWDMLPGLKVLSDKVGL